MFNLMLRNIGTSLNMTYFTSVPSYVAAPGVSVGASVAAVGASVAAAGLAYAVGHADGVQKCQIEMIQLEGSFFKYAITAVGVAAVGLIYAIDHADKFLIARIPVCQCQTTTAPTDTTDRQIREDDNCAVCLEQIQPLRVLNCGHTFHQACAQQWFVVRTTCPVCRAQQ